MLQQPLQPACTSSNETLNNNKKTLSLELHLGRCDKNAINIKLRDNTDLIYVPVMFRYVWISVVGRNTLEDATHSQSEAS